MFMITFRVDKCKFMDSKMRPLWMVFENVDELADDIRILFKNGDGEENFALVVYTNSCKVARVVFL